MHLTDLGGIKFRSLVAFNGRMNALCSRVTKSKYEKQKSVLIRDFATFLEENVGTGYHVSSVNLESAKPQDVIRFLVDRDSRGRTQSHKRECNCFSSTDAGPRP